MRPLIEAAFALKPGGVSRPVSHSNKIYVISLSEKKVDEEKFNQEKESIKERLLKAKQDKAVEEWFEAAKKKAKIVKFVN
jgi:parvulin-like peptidyl-prolyl isomerase